MLSAKSTTPAGVRVLTDGLREEARRLGLPPPLVGVDQEGGVVGRLPPPFVTTPSPMAQAATGEPESAYRCAATTARQLRSAGINLNFAPVLDVNVDPANPVIGTRAFGDDPALVTRFGLAALRGYRDGGVLATAKHFPGHGDTAIDSHLGLPTIRHDLDRLRRVELAPFAAAVRAGVPAMMTAHLVASALGDLPATLSPAVLSGLLRRELGFDGLVFTDDLAMGAIAERYGAAAAAVRAKAAGADVVVLASRRLDEQVAVAEALAAAVEEGGLPVAAFAETSRRLARLRADYKVGEPPVVVEPGAADEEVAFEVAWRGTTVLKGLEALPLPSATRLALIDCLLPRWSRAEEATERTALLRGRVEAAFPQTMAVAVEPEPSERELDRARRVVGDADAVLLVTREASRVEHQARLGRELIAAGARVIHAAVRGPYDAATLPGAAATLLTYGDPPASLLAMVDILAGRARATGRCPVVLPDGAP
jgi:beta-N-acetylhexosaminidase